MGNVHCPGLVLVGFGVSVVRSLDYRLRLDYFNLAKRPGIRRIESVVREVFSFL